MAALFFLAFACPIHPWCTLDLYTHVVIQCSPSAEGHCALWVSNVPFVVWSEKQNVSFDSPLLFITFSNHLLSKASLGFWILWISLCNLLNKFQYTYDLYTHGLPKVSAEISLRVNPAPNWWIEKVLGLLVYDNLIWLLLFPLLMFHRSVCPPSCSSAKMEGAASFPFTWRADTLHWWALTLLTLPLLLRPTCVYVVKRAFDNKIIGK